MSTARLASYVPVVRRFVLRLLLYHSAVAARVGLNATDVSSLRLLREEPLSAGDLAQQIGLTGAATTALLDRLERAGFLKRVRGTEDRRRVTVHVNQEKLGAIDALYIDQGVQMAKLLNGYNAEEFRTVMDFLERTTTILTAEANAIRELASTGG